MNFVDQLGLQKAVKELARDAANITTPIEKFVVEKDTLYFKKPLSGKSGIQQLLKPQDTQVDGVRNIDSARLPGGTHFVVTGIAISTGYGDVPSKNEDDLSLIPLYVNIDAKRRSFFNNELSIKINNKEKMKAVLRHIMCANQSDNSFEEQAYKVSPFVIPSNSVILPELNLFNVAIAPENEFVIEVALTGYRVIENAK